MTKKEIVTNAFYGACIIGLVACVVCGYRDYRAYQLRHSFLDNLKIAII